MKRNLCLAILGPTGSGKTRFAIELATELGGEIVSLDSTAVYRGFDIGTSKPTKEEQAKVPHHLIDILDPTEPFSAHHFVEHASQTIEELESRGKLPIVVGGTYFYLRALQNGMYQLPVIPQSTIEEIEREYYEDDELMTDKMHAELKTQDPASAEMIHPNDRYRLLRALAILRVTGERPSGLKPAPQTEAQQRRLWVKYAMTLSRHALSSSIVKRTEAMIQGGLIQEVKGLFEAYPQARPLQSIGYAEAVRLLKRELTEKQLKNEIIEKTRQLAKRQITWLRSDHEVRFIDFRDLARLKLEITNLQFALGDETCVQ